MAFGISDSGFLRPRLVDIKTEIESSLKATFGANIDLSAASVFSQIIGTFADREDSLWQGLEDVYNSQYPDTAFGASLDNVRAISGVPRLGALPSKILSVRLFGTPGTLVPGVTTQFSVDGSPTSIFQTDADVTLVAGQDNIQTLTFSAVPTAGQWKINFNGQETGLLAFNANAAAVQAAIALLPFASGVLVTGNYSIGFNVHFAGVSGLQSWPMIVIASNTLVIVSTPVTIAVTVVQAGVEQGIVNVTATQTGPIIANAGTLTIIVTPVSGLSSILNVTDAVVGRNLETDNEYRARSAQELQIAGAGTLEAIRAKLLGVSGVTAVIVFENVTDIPDLDGRPPHSFEAIVQGGLDQDIRDEIWATKPAGIRSDGTVIGNITDSQGQIHEVRFSRPTDIPIYVKITVTINPSFPANGVASIKQLITDFGNALGIGKEVVVIPYLISSIATIPGIEDAVLLIGIAPSPTLSDNIPIAPNEIALFDTSRVDVITV